MKNRRRGGEHPKETGHEHPSAIIEGIFLIAPRLGFLVESEPLELVVSASNLNSDKK